MQDGTLHRRGPGAPSRSATALMNTRFVSPGTKGRAVTSSCVTTTVPGRPPAATAIRRASSRRAPSRAAQCASGTAAVVSSSLPICPTPAPHAFATTASGTVSTAARGRSSIAASRPLSSSAPPPPTSTTCGGTGGGGADMQRRRGRGTWTSEPVFWTRPPLSYGTRRSGRYKGPQNRANTSFLAELMPLCPGTPGRVALEHGIGRHLVEGGCWFDWVTSPALPHGRSSHDTPIDGRGRTRLTQTQTRWTGRRRWCQTRASVDPGPHVGRSPLQWAP